MSVKICSLFKQLTNVTVFNLELFTSFDLFPIDDFTRSLVLDEDRVQVTNMVIRVYCVGLLFV